ncbi:hypothetical protein [Streptomyces sp. NPDC048428]|uniref:hypothetical protein n=1 Tax=Streptomyces sp. NPDC048428 TaxID=3154503 RepID=UPI0034448CDA
MAVAVVYFVVALAAAVTFGGTLDRQLHGPRLRAAWDGLTAEARCTGVRTEEITDVEGVPMVVSHATLESVRRTAASSPSRSARPNST